MRRITLHVALGMLAGAIAFSLGGMAILRFTPQLASRAGALLPWFMKVPTWVYLAALPLAVFVIYYRSLGWRRSVFYLVWGSFIGLMAELVGTGTGYPFGAYHYTDFLEPKILGDVPYFIPLSWYAVALLSHDLANRLGTARLQRVTIAALFMVLWDVALDPAMGIAFPIWAWDVDGFFYGMPALNWVGWFATSLLIVWGFEVLGGGPPDHRPPQAVGTWLLNGVLPVGICALTGLGGAAVIGAVAIALPPLALWNQRRVLHLMPFSTSAKTRTRRRFPTLTS